MNTLILIITALGGGGLGVAVVNVWGKIRIKKIDNALDERQQFIKELNEMRNVINELYKNYHALFAENSSLKNRVKELEESIRKKSLLVEELTMYKDYQHNLKEILEDYSESNALITIEKIKNLVHNYELSGS